MFLRWQKELVEGDILPARELEPHLSEVADVGESEPFVEPYAGLVRRDDSLDDRVVSEVDSPCKDLSDQQRTNPLPRKSLWTYTESSADLE